MKIRLGLILSAFFLAVLTTSSLQAVTSTEIPRPTSTRTPTPIPTEFNDVIMIDQNCLVYLATAKDNDVFDPTSGVPKCNETCLKSCIDDGNYCEFNKPEGPCLDGPLVGQGTKDFFNFLGYTIPSDQVLLIFIRIILFLVFSAAAFVAVYYGIRGIYKRSTSMGSPDKIEESSKIFKNAAIGLVIIFLSTIIIQIIYLLLGLTGTVFDFNFIPRSGKKIYVMESDVGRPCYPEQEDLSTRFECRDGTWQWRGYIV